MLDVALKDWGVVWEAVLSGAHAVLLRKGGVHEEEGPGRFRLAHRRFAMFPAWEHQRGDWLVEPWSGRAAAEQARLAGEGVRGEPSEVVIEGWAEAAGVWVVPSRDAFERLGALHVWREPYVDMRFGYKPDRPLYLVLLRAWRLAEPRRVAMNDRYLGCRSWVELEAGDAIDTAGSAAVVGDEVIEGWRVRIEEAMGAGAGA
ncbi:MAG: DUF1802 family protein [Planctomycetota bacterium]